MTDNLFYTIPDSTVSPITYEDVVVNPEDINDIVIIGKNTTYAIDSEELIDENLFSW